MSRFLWHGDAMLDAWKHESGGQSPKGRLMRIVTSGRTDRAALFSKSGILDYKRLSHTPFLAFVVDGDAVTVKQFESAADLARSVPSETPVMVQWQGKWSSDFFQMTAGDVAEALQARDVAGRQ